MQLNQPWRLTRLYSLLRLSIKGLASVSPDMNPLGFLARSVRGTALERLIP